ncbi:hypothetical protein TrVE_jg12269 [Triparma verrucosa]|uniref:Uncharacterized protein n=1 Tax=Triparma verrucosa TaxID=1606542 RepID=A0A9W7EST4_9STRA|nr:hypothetical protein TrVE_jg12269 [Triparma verrucosa]
MSGFDAAFVQQQIEEEERLSKLHEIDLADEEMARRLSVQYQGEGVGDDGDDPEPPPPRAAPPAYSPKGKGRVVLDFRPQQPEKPATLDFRGQRSRSQSPVPPSQSNLVTVIACSACTYENPAGSTVCAMCEAPLIRGSSATIDSRDEELAYELQEQLRIEAEREEEEHVRQARETERRERERARVEAMEARRAANPNGWMEDTLYGNYDVKFSVWDGTSKKLGKAQTVKACLALKEDGSFESNVSPTGTEPVTGYWEVFWDKKNIRMEVLKLVWGKTSGRITTKFIATKHGKIGAVQEWKGTHSLDGRLKPNTKDCFTLKR